MRIPHLIIGSALLATLFAAANAGTAAAQAPAMSSNDSVASGKTIFMSNCAVCHGDQGRGDGPAARALTPRPADLSRLTAQNGSFPAAKITDTLNGTAAVIAHGNQGMMVWQTVFNADYGNQANARIADVVKYIESLQRK